MGGLRVTGDQIEEIKKLRGCGLTYGEIANRLSVGLGTVAYHAKDVAMTINLNQDEDILDVKGYGGRYKVTSTGDVYSIKQKNGVAIVKELKQRSRKSGIKRVLLHDDDGQKERCVDELVAEAFVMKEDESYKFVRHVDGDFSNNNSSNLEWSKTDPRKDSFAFRKPVLTADDIASVREKWLSGMSTVDIAKEFGVSITTIYKQVNDLRRDIVLPKCEPGETWKPVCGYGGRYYISSHGRLFSTGCGRRAQRIVVPAVDQNGYLKVSLTNDDHNQRSELVHRLVATAFCDGRTKDRNAVNHIDGNKQNNHASNLEWCDCRENSAHAANVLGVVQGGNSQTEKKTVRTIPKDETRWSSPQRKFTDEQVRAIRSDSRSSRKIAEDYGVNKCTIINIKSGKTYRNV